MTNGNGVADPTETTQYNAFTARLLKATYNYQVSTKDPGAYAHNGKYIIELLYDSIEDLNAKLSTLAPSAAVDISLCTRLDEGHFNGASEAWRHWDVATAPALPGPPGYLFQVPCSQGHPVLPDQWCQYPGRAGQWHAVRELPQQCNRHGSTAPRSERRNLPLRVKSQYGRSRGNRRQQPVSAVSPGPRVQGERRCQDCWQRRPYSFTNVHYYAAAASLFGTQVKGGYEYTGKTYAGQNPFSSSRRQV